MALAQGTTYKLGSGIKTGVAPGQSQYNVGTGGQVKIIGSRNVGGQSYYNIQHIGGGTGWTPASSLQKAIGSTSTAKPAAKKVSTPTYIKQQYAAIPKAKVEAEKQAGIFEKSVAEAQAPLTEAQESLISQLGSRSNLEELYNQLRSERGVDISEGVIKGLQEQAIDVEGMISGLPEAIKQRVAGLPVTEAQRLSTLAKELDPLQTQQADILRGVERERSGLDLMYNAIEQALGIRQTQEAREAEPFEMGVEFAGQRFESAVDTAKSRLANVMAGAGVDIDTAKSLADTMINYRVTTEQRAFESKEAALNRSAQLEASRISAGSAIRAAEVAAAAQRDAGKLFASTTAAATKQAGQQAFRQTLDTWPSGTTLKSLMGNYAQFYPSLESFIQVYSSLSPHGPPNEGASTLRSWWTASK